MKEVHRTYLFTHMRAGPRGSRHGAIRFDRNASARPVSDRQRDDSEVFPESISGNDQDRREARGRIPRRAHHHDGAQELFDREGQECRGSSKLPHRERPHPVEQRGRRPWRPNGPSPRGDQQTQADLLASAPSSRWASQDFSERTQWWKALQRQRNLGPAGPRQSMQTDDPVSRCGPGKGTQSSISLPEVKILYLKDLSLDDGEDGDNQLERPDHPPEGAPR